MAASGSDTNTEEAFLISPRRKVEIFGLVLMVCALLVSLAFASYHPDDAVVLRSADWSAVVLNPQSAQADGPVQNVLGLLGAQLAEAFVPGFIGYGVLLISGLLMVWGYAVFRHASLRRLLYPSLLTAFSAFILSCVVGWVHHTVDASLRAWAGLVGIGTAGWMQNVFGEVGSFILLLLAGAVLLLLVVDHDIQRTVDRVIRAARRIGAGVSAAGAYIRDQWSRARAHAPEPKAPSPTSGPSSSASASGSPSASSPGPPSSSPAGERTPPPARTRPKDSGAQAPSVRRNDLFRPGRDPAPSATDDSTASPEPAPDSSAHTSDAGPPEDDASKDDASKDIPDETTASTPAEESPATDSPPPPNPSSPPADEAASSEDPAA
ncbi:DNA translocase FtsK 4TM domain-containing protein, partial [Salinibacter sp.]